MQRIREIPREESREVRKEEIEELIEGARKKAEEELAKASAVPPLGSAPLKVYYKGKGPQHGGWPWEVFTGCEASWQQS